MDRVHVSKRIFSYDGTHRRDFLVPVVFITIVLYFLVVTLHRNLDPYV